MRVYLDNCCFNRPYDDQSQLRISLEAQAKLQIQEMIRCRELTLASSYTLRYELSRNPFASRKNAIEEFLQDNVEIYIDGTSEQFVKQKAGIIMQSGIKTADAYHIASAIIAECECFITTDDRVLRYMTDEINIINPMDFMRFLDTNQ